jgi:hypothetical protein
MKYKRFNGPESLLNCKLIASLRRQLICITILSLFLCCGDLASAQASSVRCPANTFSEFLRVFSESVDVQRRYTKWPLTFSFVNWKEDTGLPFLNHMQVYSIKELPIFRGKFLFPNESARLGDELVQTILSEGISPKVVVGVPDSDVTFVYTFSQIRECWMLVEMLDTNP